MADDAYSYEAAAEQAQLHKSLHGPMRKWYALHSDLADKHGPFPMFARELATWGPFKEVQREYMRHSDRVERGAPTEVSESAPGPSPPADELVVVNQPTVASASPANGNGAGETAVPVSEAAPANDAPKRKRKRWTDNEAGDDGTAGNGTESAAPAAAPRRRSRWTVNVEVAADGEPAMEVPTARLRTRFGQRILPAATTLLPGDASAVQEALFTYRLRLDELTARTLLLPSELKRLETHPDRSPSPPPEYDSNGKRTNSREQRMRGALGEARDRLVERMLELAPHLGGPAGPRFVRKLYIPWREYPSYNFIGLVIGPRGSTQKKLERETNCKISVRGRGSGKDGKAGTGAPVDERDLSGGGDRGGAPETAGARRRREEEEDELHVSVTGERLAEVEAACKLIADLLRPVDDDNNEWKKLQLMQLAAINGMLRDVNAPCHVCGETGHRQYECPYRDAGVKRANVRCALCGDGSHVTADCKLARRGAAGGAGGGGDEDEEDGLIAEGGPGGGGKAALDSEYLSFMAELGDEGAKAVMDTQAQLAAARAARQAKVEELARVGREKLQQQQQQQQGQGQGESVPAQPPAPTSSGLSYLSQQPAPLPAAPSGPPSSGLSYLSAPPQPSMQPPHMRYQPMSAPPPPPHMWRGPGYPPAGPGGWGPPLPGGPYGAIMPGMPPYGGYPGAPPPPPGPYGLPGQYPPLGGGGGGSYNPFGAPPAMMGGGYPGVGGMMMGGGPGGMMMPPPLPLGGDGEAPPLPSDALPPPPPPMDAPPLPPG